MRVWDIFLAEGVRFLARTQSAIVGNLPKFRTDEVKIIFRIALALLKPSPQNLTGRLAGLLHELHQAEPRRSPSPVL